MSESRYGCESLNSVSIIGVACALHLQSRDYVSVTASISFRPVRGAFHIPLTVMALISGCSSNPRPSVPVKLPASRHKLFHCRPNMMSYCPRTNSKTRINSCATASVGVNCFALKDGRGERMIRRLCFYAAGWLTGYGYGAGLVEQRRGRVGGGRHVE